MALSMMSKGEWNNCFINNNQGILLDVADFALQGQPEDNLMVSISRACRYNGSYAMAANPIKSLEFHYFTIQSFKKSVWLCRKTGAKRLQRESTLTFRPLVIFRASGSYAATVCL